MGRSRSKGFEVSSEKAKKPTAIIPMTLNTRATISSGKPRLNKATAVIQPERINTHSSNEPSWLPQSAENLNIGGNKLFEFAATTATVKSSCRKLTANNAKATATNNATATASVGAKFMAVTSRRILPHIGISAKPTAKQKAIISAT